MPIFCFKRGVGRFHNSLPYSLTALGYKTMLASSCRRNFLNYDAVLPFDRHSTNVFSPMTSLAPFDVDQFEATHSDALFLHAAIDAHARDIAGDAAPRFLYALTNFNHGPHNRRLTAPGRFESERAFAAASLPDASLCRILRPAGGDSRDLEQAQIRTCNPFPRRPMLILHYGDHQPVMTRRIEANASTPTDPRRPVPYLLCHGNLELPPGVGLLPDRPWTSISHFWGLSPCSRPACRSTKFPPRAPACSRSAAIPISRRRSERKRRFHRTLVELGVIDVVAKWRRRREVGPTTPFNPIDLTVDPKALSQR